MKDVKQIIGSVLQTTKANSPIILTSAAGVGVITTAYLTGIASYKSALLIQHDEGIAGTADTPKQRLIERTKLVWKFYIPAGVSATATVVCIVGANHVEGKKTLAAATALGVTERAYSEYRDKVVEEFGARKDQSIRDSVVADQLKENPPPAILISGPGNVLCCELFTGRYFTSDMETLRKAQNDINAHMLVHDFAVANDFYHKIGLADTTYGNDIGWTSSRMLELKFSSHLTEDNRPCLAFDYNYTTGL